MRPVFAVDLGSTNTVVAASLRAGEPPQAVRVPGLSQPDEALPPLIPSLLYVTDARRVETLVGHEVVAAGRAHPADARFLSGFKRRIAAEIQGLNPDLDGLEVTPERAAGWFLSEVLRRIPGLNRDGDTVVFTVPVGSFQRYLAWVESFWPVRHWRVVDESTAAAIGYGVAAPGRRVLTCDLGGGTVDLSLVRLPDALDAGAEAVTSTVIAKASQILGGDDIDAWLVELVAARLGWPADRDAAWWREATAVAEQAKIALSTCGSLACQMDGPDGLPQEVTLTRDDLEEVLVGHEFLSRLQSAIDTILRQAARKGIEKDDIEHILLVGGTSQIPAVRRALQQNFGAPRVHCERVFTAAALGAACLGQGVEVNDFLYHSYAVRGWNHHAQRHEYDLVVPALSPYPFGHPVIREYAASAPNQTAMEIYIGEIEHGDVSRPEVLMEDRHIRIINAPAAAHRYALVDADRAVPLNNGTVVPLEPPAHPGVNRVRVEFMVDDQRRLRLTVVDLEVQRVLLRDVSVAMLT